MNPLDEKFMKDLLASSRYGRSSRYDPRQSVYAGESEPHSMSSKTFAKPSKINSIKEKGSSSYGENETEHKIYPTQTNRSKAPSDKYDLDKELRAFIKSPANGTGFSPRPASRGLGISAAKKKSNPEINTRKSNPEIKEIKEKIQPGGKSKQLAVTPDKGLGPPSIYPFKFPSVILAVGKAKRGKSTMIKQIVLGKCLAGYYQFGIVFCKTKFNHGYDWLPDKAVIEGFDEQVLDKYLSALKQHRQQTKQAINNFIIFDDLQGILTGTSQINNLLSTFRHYGSSIFICVQYLNQGVSTTIRENTDYVIAFNSKTENTIKSLWKNFGQMFNNYTEFKQHFLRTTSKPYTAMLFNEDEEDMTKNYIPIKADDPTTTEGIKIEF